MKLRELEKRLKLEPDNLGLRVAVAGLMREAGRSVEAVELYRSVAIAYRDQGRTQQAIAVCRSILEVAPEDAACRGLLGTLEQQPTGQRPSAPPRASAPIARPSESSLDETPLPRPVPHHVVDPTSQPQRISAGELDLPSIDLAAEVETRQRPRITSEQVRKLEAMPDTSPISRVGGEPMSRDSESDLETEPRAALPATRPSDDALTPAPQFLQRSPSGQGDDERTTPGDRDLVDSDDD